MSLSNIKVIIHDWDDTITGSFEAYKVWHYDFAKHFGLPTPNDERIKAEWGKTVPGIISGLWTELSLQNAEKMMHEYIRVTTKTYIPQLFTGVNETLEKLQEKYVLAVLSSGLEYKIKSLINMHLSEKARTYKFVLCAENCAVHKPNPKVFDYAFDHLSDENIVSEQVLYVGDSVLDYFAAKGKEMPFVATTSGITSKQQFLDNGLEEQFIIESFKDLPD